MMKNMILPIAFTALIASMTACSDETDPILTQKNWDGTATYFQSSDEHGFSMYYKPQVGFVGDPMPFYDPVAKDFKVMYLQDYRPNPEATYHPIFGVATKDGATYESLGELISCGGRDEQDAAIGTGGTIYNPADKLYYTFYTGNKFKPSSDQNAQVVMVATSPDFKTWTKNRTFYLKGDTYGYDKNDFRDPFLFQTEDGVYHMLIATRKNGKGHIAEFTSADLKEWESAGTFMTMMWDRFYECPDVFKMGDWWYLIYSEQASFMRKVQYFKGRTLEDLKATTANDAGIWPDNREGMLDSRAFYAGKTASLADLADGAQVAVPNDVSNEARALLLLADNGLIELKEGVGLEATKNDIVKNDKNLKIMEIEAAQLPRSLGDVDIAVINGNYAIEAGLKVSDALATEDSQSIAATTYGNVVAVRKGEEKSDATLALIDALTSETVKQYIEDTYQGAVVPLF